MICWGSNFDSFVIKDILKFVNLLPSYFTTKNMASFIRQLNLYGFKKKRNNNGIIEFSHPLFVKDHIEDITKIKKVTKQDKDKKLKEEYDEVKDNYKMLQQQYNKMKMELKSLASHNKNLEKYNQGLYNKLKMERKEYKDDLRNLLLLFFNSMKLKTGDLMTVIKNLLLNNKILSGKEKELLINSTKIVGLIPIIIEKIIEDKTTKNAFLNKLINLFHFDSIDDKQIKEDLLVFYKDKLTRNSENMSKIIMGGTSEMNMNG